MTRIIRGSLYVHQGFGGFQLYGKDAETGEMFCLGNLEGRVPDRELRKIGGGYNPNEDRGLARDYSFRLVEEEKRDTDTETA